ncbi:hypothetical protein ACH5RR_023019 [Cinchona calisaya]|uniref:Uncharacterized protein n=1 Tax=Cinchona calisaya TaxID=153742 RepID=A0ABD2Z9G2_9GENT
MYILKLRTRSFILKNIKLRESLTQSSSVTCGSPKAIADFVHDEHLLKVKNYRLKEEIAHMTSLAAKYARKSYGNNTSASSSLIHSNSIDLEVVALGVEEPDITRNIIVEEDLLRSLPSPTDIDKSTAM